MVGVLAIPGDTACTGLQQLFPPKKQRTSAAAVNPKQTPLLRSYPQKSPCLSEGSFLQTGVTWVAFLMSLSPSRAETHTENQPWPLWLQEGKMPAETSEIDSPIVYTFGGNPSTYRRGE